jgi:demethylmenaquinone methyltransferase/2-methoxy-6-polyprenyl-1,4-benzoquinol methylase
MIGSFSKSVRTQITTADDKRSYNRRLFTRVAHEYDSATRLMSFYRDAAWKRRLMQMLPDLAHPHCVDLACGTGDVTQLLAARFPGGRIFGTDLTPAMLQVAQRQNRHANVAYQSADMLRLPFPNASADVITGSYALRNAPILTTALTEIHRVLRPGGYAAFLDFRRPDNPRVFAAHRRVLQYWCGACSIIVHGRPEHTYIAESLRSFPSVSELARVLSDSGLPIIRRESAMFGTMDLILCRRQ